MNFKEILSRMGETGELGENPHGSLLSGEANKGRIRPEAGDVGDKIAQNRPESPSPKPAPIKEIRPIRPIRPDEREKVIRPEQEVDELHRERRRAKVLAMLAERPGTGYAVSVEDADSDPVVATIAIKGIATFEVDIPHRFFDGVILLQLIEKHSKGLP